MQGTPLLPPLFGTAALKDTGTTEGTVPLRTVNGALVGPMAWSELTNTPTTLSGYGITDAATSAQGSLADTAVQPGDLATVATTGSYIDLLNKPTITTGTVESVGLALPTQFTITGSPVTSTGTLTAAWASQTQAHVLAAPSDGNGTPAFRALVATDIPTLNQNTTGTAANVTGTVAIANGGTGATTDADARTNLGLAIGTNVQAYDADLGAIAALTTTGLIDRTGAGTATTRTTGTTGLALLATETQSEARAAIGSTAFAGDGTATITTNSVVRAQIDEDGNVSSSIPGGATLLPEFKCRAWVNWNGQDGVIRASGNVSSVTRQSTGVYTVNLATAMPDANYCAIASSSRDVSGSQVGAFVLNVSPSQVQIDELTNLTFFDPVNMSVSVFR